MARSRHRLIVASMLAGLLAAACSPEPGSGPGPAQGESDPTTPAMMADQPEDPTAVDTVALSDGAATARERCLVAVPYLAAAEEARGEVDDEEDELSEEELHESYAPEFPTVDGVAAPDDRASIDAMPAYDPATAGYEELDALIASCIENNIVTEAELFGDEDEDAWCQELAALTLDEVREFADEEGIDVVREEFEWCELANPLDADG